MKIKFVIAFLGAALMALSGNAFALKCVDAATGGVHIRQSLPSDITVTAGDPDGKLIWESPAYNISVRCSHDQQLITEGVYLYVNPNSMSAGKGTSVGIRWRGNIYMENSGRIALNQTILDSQDSVTFPFSFTVVVLKSGASPATGKSNFSNYKVFQVDGVGGINSMPDSNLDFMINGTIRFSGCPAGLTFAPSNIVNFGDITPTGTVGSVAVEREIVITASRECLPAYSLRMSFTPGSPLKDTYTMNFRNGTGVSLVDKGSGAKLPLNGTMTDFVDLRSSNTGSKVYVAQLMRLVRDADVGPFSGGLTLNLEYH